MATERSHEPRARFALRLLGSFDVLLDGDRVEVFNAPRPQRFVGLLAIRGDPQPRARLAYELWPESTDTQARTNLRKLLHELRHTVPYFDHLVAAGDDTVGLDPEGGVDVDLWRFRAAVAVGDPDLAVRLYRGELLPASYDEWVLEERDQLHTEVHRLLRRLAEDSADRGDHDATLRHCHRLLDHEPTDEAAVRLLMEAHLALGDRAAALRAYHRCVEVLDRELQVEPSEAVADVYRRLRVAAARSTGSPVADVAPIGESPFVGREAELGVMWEAWERVRAGGAHLLVVSGEPGIGKSRLAAELGRRVRRAGHDVATARAFEAAGRLPWAPVVDLLRSDDIRTDLDALAPVWQAELRRLVPELPDGDAAVEAAGSDDLSQRYRLFEAAGRALAGPHPRLIVLDDLQWCDADTVELLGYVVRAHPDAPLLVVGTVRPEEVADDHPLPTLTAALHREDAVTTITLGRFDESETLALAARLEQGGAADPEAPARIWQETEGIPLFVVELCRARLGEGTSGATLTPTMRSVLRARLTQLPDESQRLAEIGAVIGRPFSVSRVASITGRPEDDVVDAIDELWRRRIIVDRGASYDFSHDKLRAVALEAVSPARRRQLHRAVAEAIEADSPDPDAQVAQLAAHYDQAGMTEAALDAYRRAGAKAAALSSLEEAVVLFRRGLAVLADLPPTAERDAVELDLRVALGAPLVAVEGYGAKDAHQLYERARTLSRRLDRSVAPPVLRGLGLARLQGCRFDDADEMSRALVDNEQGDPVAITEGHYLLGVSAFWRGDLRAARSNLEAALAGYVPAHRDEHLTLYAQDPRAICLVRLGWLELWEGDPARADEHARAALRAAEDLDHQMTSAYVGTYAGVVAAEAGDLDRLGEVLDFLDAVWSRVPMPYLMILGDALRGWLEVSNGSAGGIERIVKAAAAVRAEGETLHLTYCLLLLARARARAGEWREGRAAASEAVARSGQWTQRYLEAELLRMEGELAFEGGDTEAAADALRRAVDIADTQGAQWLRMRALHALACRFPEPAVHRELEDLLDHAPSGHDLPPFRAARSFVAGPG